MSAATHRSRGMALGLLLILGFPVGELLAQGKKPFEEEIAASAMTGIAETAEDATERELSWVIFPRPPVISRHGALAKGLVQNAEQNFASATHSLNIPAKGKYTVWVRYAIHPSRAKPFSVTIQGEILKFALLPYGASPDEKFRSSDRDSTMESELLEKWKNDREANYGDQKAENQMIWTRHEVSLDAGASEIVLAPISRKEIQRGIIPHPPEVDAILVTNNPNKVP